MCHVSSGIILRLPCKTESNFDVIIDGRKLVNHLIGQKTVNTVDECYRSCEDQDGCRSVNFRQVGNDNCQLNKNIRETASESEFEVSDTWTYHATRHNKTNVSKNCITLLRTSLT